MGGAHFAGEQGQGGRVADTLKGGKIYFFSVTSHMGTYWLSARWSLWAPGRRSGLGTEWGEMAALHRNSHGARELQLPGDRVEGSFSGSALAWLGGWGGVRSVTGPGPDHASRLCLPLEVAWSFKNIPMPRSAADIPTSLVGGSGRRGPGLPGSATVCFPRRRALRAALCGGQVQTCSPRCCLTGTCLRASILASCRLTPGPGAWTRLLASDHSCLSGSGFHTQKGRRPVLAATIGTLFAA